MNATTHAGLARGNEAVRRILTFNGLVILNAATLGAPFKEIQNMLGGNIRGAQATVKADEQANAKQSAAQKTAAKAKSSAAAHQRWLGGDWQRWNHGSYHRRTWCLARSCRVA